MSHGISSASLNSHILLPQVLQNFLVLTMLIPLLLYIKAVFSSNLFAE